MKRAIVYLGMILISQNLFSQEGEEKEQLQVEEPKQEVSNKLSNFTISGYTEVFYSYDFNQRADHIRQPFFYTFNRHNEVNVNIARLKAEYATDNMRANIALMAGTYPEDNLSAEQGMLKLVQEANIGFRISKTKNLWIDTGVMPSYIGSEGEISKDNLALTRTIAVAQEPFFMTGAQITYITDNNKWTFMGGVYNGWQIIKRQNSNTKLPAFGARVAYQPNEKWFFNSSAYIGKDPATETKMRYFNIKKFEENKGKQDYDNEYHYKLLDRSEVREFSIMDNSEVFYIREISKKGSPFNYFYSYDKNGNLSIEKKYFNNSILTHTEWDKIVRL